MNSFLKIDSKIEGISKNLRVRLPDKDDEEISDGEIDDEIDVEATAKIKQKYEMQAKIEKSGKIKTKGYSKGKSGKY